MAQNDLKTIENTYNKGKSKQRYIEVQKAYIDIKEYNKEKKPYILLDKENFDNALQVLSPYAFQLYMYFAVNSYDYKFFLSSKHFMEACGNSQKTDRYIKSFKELQEKGFIVYQGNITLNKITYNHYFFYDKQQTIEQEDKAQEPKPEQESEQVSIYTENFKF